MRVLLILDGSARAVEEALDHAARRQAELCALYVQDGGWRDFTGNDWLSTSNSYASFLEYIEGQEKDEARRTIADFVRRGEARGLESRVKLARGDVSTQVLEELRQGYDLVVMGYPLRRGLDSRQGASERIIKGAPCSLHLVKELN